jgi:hypothetical protein
MNTTACEGDVSLIETRNEACGYLRCLKWLDVLFSNIEGLQDSMMSTKSITQKVEIVLKTDTGDESADIY